jgi:hypothetical protein
MRVRLTPRSCVHVRVPWIKAGGTYRETLLQTVYASATRLGERGLASVHHLPRPRGYSSGIASHTA